jgi:phytoene dehydrogenase-like protein
MKKLLLSLMAGMLFNLSAGALEKPATADVDPETAALQKDIDAIKAQQTKVSAADGYELSRLVELMKQKYSILKQKSIERSREELDRLNKLISDLNSKVNSIKTKIK